MKELEERGIGRPSTYAAVIDTIQARGYVWRKGTALVPAWTAFAVTNLLERHFGHLVDYWFTATMEEALDVIARGEGEAEKWLHSFYYGNGTPGLRELVDDEHLAQHRSRGASARSRSASTTPVTRSSCASAATGRTCSAKTTRPRRCRPKSRPTSSRVELALDLIAKQSEGPKTLGTDPDTELAVYVLTGRFGPYVQLGEQLEGTKKKPKRASLLLDDDARHRHARRGAEVVVACRASSESTPKRREITASPGRFGPYLKRADGETRSLTSEEQLFTLTLAEAEALYAQPKLRRGRQQKPPIAELGPNPDNEQLGTRARRSVRRVRDRRRRERDRAARAGSRRAHARRGCGSAAGPGRDGAAQGEARPKKPAKKTAKKTAKKAAKKPAKKAAAKKPAKKAAAKKPAKQAAKKSTDSPALRVGRVSRRRGSAPRAWAHGVTDQAPFIPSTPDQEPIPPKPWQVFRAPGFPQLFAAQVVSSIGDWIGFVAILVFAGDISANAIGLVMIARMLPGFLLAPIGGALVDRWNRKVVMVTCDIGRAGLLAVLPFWHNLLGLVVISFSDRGPDAALGPGEGRDGSERRQGSGSARVGELARARRRVRHVSARRVHVRVARGGLAGSSATSTAFVALHVDQVSLAIWVDGFTFVASAILISRLHLERATVSNATASARREPDVE